MDNDQLGGGGEARVLERALEELKRDTVLAQRRARAYSLTAGLAMGGGGIVLFANLTGRIEINPLFIILIAIIILVIVGFLVISYLNEDVPEILAGAFSAATSILGISISPRRQADDAQGVLKLRAEVARLQQEVQAISTGARRQDFNEVVENLARKVAATASSDLVAHVERRLDSIERSDLYEARHAMEAFGMTRQRIAFALQRLGRRGAVNLTLGGLITVCGAAMLSWFVIGSDTTRTEPLQYALHFLPRLSIVILIQVFALFFLRLYKVGLDEIKYFENEMTNVEQRQVALSVALLQDDPDLRAKILLDIAKTDRNNVLEKGQSTIELEKARIEAQGGTIETLRSLLPMIVRAK